MTLLSLNRLFYFSAVGLFLTAIPGLASSAIAVKSDKNITQVEAGVFADNHFNLAEAYAMDGNVDRAIEEYQLTLMYDPKSAFVHTRLATELIKKGQFSAAMDVSKRATEIDPKYAEAHLILGELYSISREYQGALNEYRQVLKLDPSHEEAVLYASQILIETNAPDKAILELKSFVKKNPDSALAYYYLGKAYEDQKQFKSAAESYSHAMKTRPGFTQAGISLGQLYELQKQDGRAIQLYVELYNETQDVAVASRIASVYLKQAQFALALPYLRAMAKMDPDDLNVQVKIGLVQMELKSMDEAIHTFKKILEKDPESERIHYYLGSIYEAQGKYEQAIASLKKIPAKSELYVEAVLHATFLFKRSARTDEARSYLKDAMNKTPARIAAMVLLEASLEEDTKNYRGAIRILETAIQKFPEDEKVRYYLGSLYDHEGAKDKSIEQMEEILKVNPKNVEALNYIGYTWTLQGIRLDDAEKLLKRAVSLKPDNGYVHDSWGWHLYTRGKVQQAVIELEKAVKMSPKEATILDHLGDAYLRANLRQKALGQYLNAIKYSADEHARLKFQTKVNMLNEQLLSRDSSGNLQKGRTPTSLSLDE